MRSSISAAHRHDHDKACDDNQTMLLFENKALHCAAGCDSCGPSICGNRQQMESYGHCHSFGKLHAATVHADIHLHTQQKCCFHALDLYSHHALKICCRACQSL